MMNDWIEIIIGIFIEIFVPLALVLFILFVCVYGGYALNASKQCLDKGYPEYRITYDFDAYCMTLDGTITVTVDKLK